jgi:DNA modification methylase
MTLTSNDRLNQCFEHFARDAKPLVFQFRAAAADLTTGERATHFLHPYPAKLIRHIPYLFLRAPELSNPGDVVLDPFCGSGTVLVEALLNGRHAIGADANPLARLMARVKTRRLNVENTRSRLAAVLIRAQRCAAPPAPPDVVNIDHWFYKHVQRQLSKLIVAIDGEDDDTVRDFFRVCLSATLKHVSLADPRLSVPVRLRAAQYDEHHWLRQKTEARLRRLKRINAVHIFASVVNANLRRASDLNARIDTDVAADVVSCDARDLRRPGCRRRVADASVDLVITSPPYPGAQKYVRASSLSLGWLRLAASSNLRPLEAMNIGREHYRKDEYKERLNTGIALADEVIARIHDHDPLRAHIAANYLVEMRPAISEIWRVLKPGGRVVLVAGTNRIARALFDTQDYLTEMLRQLGFFVELRLIDDIHSRGLMTKRNRTADVISQEWVTVARKPVNA